MDSFDASAPIIVGGRHIANWFIGQSNTMGVDEEQIVRYAREIGADPGKIREAFSTMPTMKLERFQKILELLWIIAEKLSMLGYKNLKLAKELEQRKIAESLLQEKGKKSQAFLNHI